MKDTDIKIKRQSEYMQKYTLNKEDQHKLIREKLERARVYSQALKKREALCGGR